MTYLDVADEYDKVFMPDSKMVFGQAGGEPIVIDHTEGAGTAGISDSYTMPYDKEPESPEMMIDRIRRSQSCGRNLFFEEWVAMPPYEDGCEY